MLFVHMQQAYCSLVQRCSLQRRTPSERNPCAQGIIGTIHEASCVLISCLCDLSSRARHQIVEARGVVARLIELVMTVTQEDILAAAAARPAERASDGSGAAGSSGEPQNQALVSALGQLMQTSGPDNYVFQAAMQAMRSMQRGSHGMAEHASLDARSASTVAPDLADEGCAPRLQFDAGARIASRFGLPKHCQRPAVPQRCAERGHRVTV
jgi:hypothetical protein